MKTKKIIQVLGIAAMLGISASAFAHGDDDYRPGYDNNAFHKHPVFQQSLRLMIEVNERQDKQMDRILSGLYEKRITPQEFRKLMDGQRDIQRMERQFLADGLLSRHEYQKLDSALDAANRSIFREKHDAQGRPGYGEGYDSWRR
jgi:hypothetical protein